MIMNDEQMKTFIASAQMGIACGLSYPHEWMINSFRNLYHVPWKEIPTREANIEDAFLAFYRGTGSMPGDPVEKWTKKDLWNYIDTKYKQKRSIK